MNFLADATTVATSIDLSGVVKQVETTLMANIGQILPTCGVIFASIFGVKMAPKVIKWFTKG